MYTKDGVDWDGIESPYRPTEPLQSGSTKLHHGSDTEIDPITFEVLSTKLWNINEEHANTIKQVSGSPVVVFNDDFNTCICDESGDPVLFAPYIQYFTGNSEYIIKYTLEHRMKNPGIKPGDIFVHNDPFIAGSHQMDIGVYAPVFVGDEIFCWVFNACHVRDFGGVEPGSFCAQAPDIFHDPPMVRALKLVDENGILEDAEDTMMRMSRLPHLLALELRSQIAGIERARARVLETVGRYGADQVKASMRKIMDDTESTVSERLLQLPDGRWSDVAYVSGAVTGDRNVYRLALNLEKKGDRLYFDNDGTDPQVGCINCSFGQFRSAILTAVTQLLAFDHKYCVGGVARLAEFVAEIGTISAVDRNGAFSALHAQLQTVYMATRVVSKMIYPNEELRRRIVTTSGVSTCAWLTHSGTDQWGKSFATASLDEVASGLGAFSFRDGVDQGGATFWPKSEVGDCESWEQYFPVLYLYRRSALNGGHGKFRGGHGIALAWVGHDTDDQHASVISVAPELSTQSGLFGGHWGESGRFFYGRDSGVRDELKAGSVPGSYLEVKDLSGSGEDVLPKTIGLRLGENDVITMSVFGAGGYGDPIDRDPQAVAEDLAAGEITEKAATDVYGVEIAKDGAPDLEASVELRESLRSDRLKRAKQPAAAASFDGDLSTERELADGLALASAGDDSHWLVCRHCEAVLQAADGNYKDGCACLDTALPEIDPEVFADNNGGVDAEIVYRMFLCPGCGHSLENELTTVDREPFWDTQVALSPDKNGN